MTDTAIAIHPMASEHLPNFIPTAAGDDWLFTFVTVGVLLATLLLGVGYLSLHSLPERLAHKNGGNPIQFQIVGILALLALFTHNNVFWIFALLLAVVRFPDFTTPLNNIASSLRRLEPSLQGEAKAAGFRQPNLNEAGPGQAQKTEDDA